VPRTDNPPNDPLNKPAEGGSGTRKPLRARTPAAGTKCGGTKRNKQACTLPAGYLTDHPGFGNCCWHGGATDTGKAAAAQDRAAGLIKFYGKPIDTDPISVLLDEVRRTAGHVAFLGEKLANWPREQEDENGAITPALTGWLKLYQTERDHLVKVSKAALDAGVNERLVQIAEHQGMRLADTIETILNQLQLSPEQRAMVPDIVPHALRQLSGTPIQMIEGQVE
jgi:hypothetical protein